MASAVHEGGEERNLWLRWVLANSVGEAAGLGLTALVGLALFAALGTDAGVLPTLGLAAGAVLAGTLIEGLVVGTAQWLVLRLPLPALR